MDDGATPGMIPDQRREFLLRQLHQRTVLSVHELTELLSVSHMTVRRDIAALERAGKVFSVPGGVRLASQLRAEPSYDDKSVTDLPNKTAMAREAAGLIADGMTLYLDAGTTLLQMAPDLRDRDLTVVTNDFNMTAALLDSDVDLVHIGGRVEHRNRSTVGTLATGILTQVNIDLAFISTSSWDRHRGSTTPSESKVVVKRAAMASAATSVLVAGSDKYGTVGMYRVADLPEFDIVITDEDLAPAAAAGIRDRGVDLRPAARTG